MGYTHCQAESGAFLSGGGADKSKPESGRMALVAVLDHIPSTTALVGVLAPLDCLRGSLGAGNIGHVKLL